MGNRNAKSTLHLKPSKLRKALFVRSFIGQSKDLVMAVSLNPTHPNLKGCTRAWPVCLEAKIFPFTVVHRPAAWHGLGAVRNAES